MKKILVFIISLIMILSTVGCMDDNSNSLPINPNISNSANTDESSKKPSSDNSAEMGNGENSENGGNLGEDNNSSSSGQENKPSNETDDWTDFF